MIGHAREMLGGPYTVTVDGASPATRIDNDNGTHTSIYSTYLQLHHNDQTIEITGTTVIPEAP